MQQRVLRYTGLVVLLLLAVAGVLLKQQGQATPATATVPRQATGTAVPAAGRPTATATTASRGAPTPTPTATTPAARGNPTPTAPRAGALPAIPFAQLPPEAQQTIRLIEGGGPFPYDRDGIVFSNREGLLPPHPEGYYHEYTVITPGSADRGARRIIAGGPGEYYYTDDHYESFKRVQR